MDLAARDHLVAGILNKCVFYIKRKKFLFIPYLIHTNAVSHFEKTFRAETKHGLHVFDIPTVANEIGYTVKQFVNQLQNLKVWNMDAHSNYMVKMLDSVFIAITNLRYHQPKFRHIVVGTSPTTKGLVLD